MRERSYTSLKYEKGQGGGMKNSRIIFVLILAVTLIAGCAHSTGKSAKTSASPVIDRIMERGEITVGTAGSMPPLNMTNKEGGVIGLEADIAQAVATSMGVKLRMKTMPFAELLPALESGKLDMVISGMTITMERNMKVAFVGPYLKSGKAFLTKVDTIANADETKVLNRPEVKFTALKGSTSQNFIESALPKATLVTAADYDEAVDMVLQDRVHAMVADYPICLISLVRYPDKGLMSVITPFTYEPLGIAVPANDPHLINWTENFLGLLEGSGSMKMLKKRWFEDASWLNQLP
jgi:polar amino acid transport system substrate-binding protein